MSHCLVGTAGVNGLARTAGPRGPALGGRGGPGRSRGSPRCYRHRLPDYDYEGASSTAARSRLGEEAFEAAWAEGRAMTPEAGRRVRPEEPGAARRIRAPASLPRRPQRPRGRGLRLVARGMTNAQIAKELYISPRTVNAHLGSVYHKIGSSTRAEATRFASEHGLL